MKTLLLQTFLQASANVLTKAAVQIVPQMSRMISLPMVLMVVVDIIVSFLASFLHWTFKFNAWGCWDSTCLKVQMLQETFLEVNRSC